MKKNLINLTIMGFCILCLFSCNRGNETIYKYYQLKNNSEKDLMLKLYFWAESRVDTVYIDNADVSEVCLSFIEEPIERVCYIFESDSIDVYAGDEFLKRYTFTNWSYGMKTPYNYNSYEKVQDEKYGEINVYTFLPEDFE